ncbi:hypothetical protein ABPG74_004407 [Tetrahymena malaccensis]
MQKLKKLKNSNIKQIPKPLNYKQKTQQINRQINCINIINLRQNYNKNQPTKNKNSLKNIHQSNIGQPLKKQKKYMMCKYNQIKWIKKSMFDNQDSNKNYFQNLVILPNYQFIQQNNFIFQKQLNQSINHLKQYFSLKIKLIC